LIATNCQFGIVSIQGIAKMLFVNDLSQIFRQTGRERDEYVKTLLSGDIVISTADHEFFGVAMLEATYCGCYPIVPNKLVYPEIYPKENLYNTSNALVKKLYNFCRNPRVFRKQRDQFFETFSFERFSAQELVPKYLELLNINTS